MRQVAVVGDGELHRHEHEDRVVIARGTVFKKAAGCAVEKAKEEATWKEDDMEVEDTVFCLL